MASVAVESLKAHECQVLEMKLSQVMADVLEGRLRPMDVDTETLQEVLEAVTRKIAAIHSILPEGIDRQAHRNGLRS